MTMPLFQAPDRVNNPEAETGDGRADLIEVGRALESMRDAGFDLTAAAGEPIDNSIEAAASIIRVLTVNSKDKKAVETMAFADNGRGIPPDVLPHVLRMGYSTRYDARQGLGRFGVGLKLAGLSVARRLEIVTKPAGVDKFYYVYLDLDEIQTGEQRYIQATEVDDWPEDFRQAMMGPDDAAFPHGTLVIWRKVDRIRSGGSFGTALAERESDLRKFIARAYRKFLAKGLQVELNGTQITLHDPLFLMENPRLNKRYKNLRGHVVDEDDLEVGEHKVHVIVTLVPEHFRPAEGVGGSEDADGKDIREFQINRDTSGRLSMLRNGREIYYDIVPKLLPGGIDKVDRYIGIEVSFPAELDEYFQVRHVKRGAEPVSKLREQLRLWLERPMRQARKEIRNHWGEVQTAQRQSSPTHTDAVNVAEGVERAAPQGQAGLDISPEKQEQIVQDVIEDVLGDAADEEPERAQEIRRGIEEGRMALFDGGWNGQELFEIKHVNGKATMILNRRHAFMRDIYGPVSKVADDNTEDMTVTDFVELARRVEVGLDLLFLSYAKAENLHRDPEQFDKLRSYWGIHLQDYIKDLLAKRE